jgi:hypothetical protein
MADWIVIAEAVQQTSYTREHISLLIRQGKVVGRKAGGVWLVELDSLKAYEARMTALGDKKFTPKRSADSHI